MIASRGVLTFSKYRTLQQYRNTLLEWNKSRLLAVEYAKDCQSILSLPKAISGFSDEQNSRSIHQNRTRNGFVLGIETSCDDTGAAVVDIEGNIIGEALNSQTRIHVEMGGIMPPLARDLHKEHIRQVVEDALNYANMSLEDVDAIACTVKPGLPMSLSVGFEHTKKLVQESKKPFIPIHHMEAHALTARMLETIPFPFLVLLISGGHCLLALVKDVDDFVLLGKGIDDAPGDAFDKTARSLKLKNLSECSGMSGGQSIEHMALRGDPTAFKNKMIMGHNPHCNFSFAGIKAYAQRIIKQEEKKYGIEGGDMLPNIPDISASFQYFVLHHLSKRIQRGLIYCLEENLLPEDRTLVLSGGVASNTFLREGLRKMCDHYNCRLVCPPPKLCTDNGIMIAWNGMEKYKRGIGVEDIEKVEIKHRCPLGRDITEVVEKKNIRRLERVKLI